MLSPTKTPLRPISIPLTTPTHSNMTQLKISLSGWSLRRTFWRRNYLIRSCYLFVRAWSRMTSSNMRSTRWLRNTSRNSKCAKLPPLAKVIRRKVTIRRRSWRTCNAHLLTVPIWSNLGGKAGSSTRAQPKPLAAVAWIKSLSRNTWTALRRRCPL